MIVNVKPVIQKWNRLLTLGISVLVVTPMLHAENSIPPNSEFEIVVPQPYERALRNPMKGFTTGSEWENLRMLYIKWNDIENHESDGIDKIRNYVDNRWRGLPESNVKVIPRVYLNWSREDQSHWPSDMETGDFTSEQFQTRVVRLIERLGMLWDNDPRVAFIEVGLIGRWGEHHGPSPTPEVQDLISDAFERSFPNTHASVRHPWQQFNPGQFGVYWDSFAHNSQMYRHGGRIANMIKEDPTFWKRNYIGGEVAYDWGDFEIQPGSSPTDSVAKAVHRNFIINTIRWLHTTQLRWISLYDHDNPEARAGAELIQKAFGYRYLLEEAKFSRRASNDGSFSLHLKIRNEGSAPFYYDWPLEVSLLDPVSLEPVWKSNYKNVDIRNWLPGSGWPEPDWSSAGGGWQGYFASWPEGPLEYANPAEQYLVEGNFQAELPKGEYIIAVAILDPAGNVPSVRFATANYLNGGRHPLGRIAFGQGAGGALPEDFTFDDPFYDKSLHYILPEVVLLPYFEVEKIDSNTFELNASPSSIEGSEIVDYKWDLNGDGSIDATGKVVRHRFNTTGSQLVRLMITAENGQSHFMTRRVMVEAPSSGD